MENPPQITRIQKLKNKLFLIKKTHDEREYLEKQRLEAEEKILKLKAKREKKRYEDPPFDEEENEKLMQGLKIKVRELDHALDTIDEDASTPGWEVEKELTACLLEKFPKEEAVHSIFQEKISALKTSIESLAEVIEVIDQINEQVHQVLGTGKQSKKRGFLHFMFGKSPYLVAAEKMARLEKNCRKLLQEAKFTKELTPLFHPVIEACQSKLYLKNLAQIFSGVALNLNQQLLTLTEKKISLEQELKKNEKELESWLFKLAEKS